MKCLPPPLWGFSEGDILRSGDLASEDASYIPLPFRGCFKDRLRLLFLRGRLHFRQRF